MTETYEIVIRYTDGHTQIFGPYTSVEAMRVANECMEHWLAIALGWSLAPDRDDTVMRGTLTWFGGQSDDHHRTISVRLRS